MTPVFPDFPSRSLLPAHGLIIQRLKHEASLAAARVRRFAILAEIVFRTAELN